MVANFLAGGAAINVLAGWAGAEVTVVDAGIVSDPGDMPGLVSRRLGPGTADFTTGPAMSLDQAIRSLEIGIELAERLAAGNAVACGEMGIGNTTAASAISAVLLKRDAAEVTGRGTGVDTAAWQRKVAVVEAALALHRPDPARPLDVIGAVGGFEIGVLAGLMLGAASRRCAIVLDGFISTAAALVATGLAPAARDYMLASHLSTETGHPLALDHLGLRPLLDLDLRLGEGSGAALALPLIDAACRIQAEMATFAEAGVAAREDDPLRE
jgi:nicotinate-nucleotide--dimethylbenzimidazole phosphoribosyltransferase